MKDKTRKEMMKLKTGDTFIVNGEKHTASVDAHLSGDASVDCYIVYDENDESWFDDDFPDE